MDFDRVTQLLLCSSGFEVSIVQPFGVFLSLRFSGWFEMEVKIRKDKTVGYPAFCSSHGLCYSDIKDVGLSDYNVLNQVPVFRAMVHPFNLVFVW